MDRYDEKYNEYIRILKEELKPAMGCTEPIAIAYASAKAREILGTCPDNVIIKVSRNIIKNVKSVVVPHTGGLRGICAAAAAGIVAGVSSKQLEVLSDVNDDQIKEIGEFLQKAAFEVCCCDSTHIFDIMLTLTKGKAKSFVRITDYHTNIVRIELNDTVLYEKKSDESNTSHLVDYSVLNVKDIVAFTNLIDVEAVKPGIKCQVEYNTAIVEEGLKNNYGANIGKVLLKTYGDDVKIRARAKAAAGSDARMNGCEMPVVINSGSGNQGITASIPVIEYAKEIGVSEEKMYRALNLSNLLTVHMKTGIGRLSAYCGAIIAGCASGAGIAYLYGGEYTDIAHTLVNSLAIVSGIICDGAKASCAAKIASAVDAGIIGYHMFVEGQQFVDGDGIVKKGVENTIDNVCKLASVGMMETDKEIVNIMLGK